MARAVGSLMVVSTAPEAERGEAPAEAARTVVVLGGFAESLLNFRGSLLRTLVERGHRVVACAPAAAAGVVDALAAMGVEYRDVPFKRAGLRPDQDLRALGALVSLFRKIRPDIILCYTIKPVIYGLLAGRLAGVPRRFAMITGLGYAFGNRGLKARLVGGVVRQLYRLSLRCADQVFFQNPDDRALFVRLGIVDGPEQAVIINGSGVEIDAFQPAPILEGPPSFLLIARLLRDKGIGEYVEAARILRARYPQAVFRLVGWIDENPATISEQELKAWMAEGVVEYLGRLDDVRPAIAAASVYVLPSYYREGTPRTVLEAMAMGRPVVTTDAPGCRETVREGVNGYLVPVRDAAALAQALERFLAEPGLIEAMGREGRRIAVEKYDVRKVNAVILKTMGLAE